MHARTHQLKLIVLCREDIDHIARLIELMDEQHKHLILLNKFGASSKSLAILAGLVSDSQIHLIDANLKDAEYREMMITTFVQVGAHIFDAHRTL